MGGGRNKYNRKNNCMLDFKFLKILSHYERKADDATCSIVDEPSSKPVYGVSDTTRLYKHKWLEARNFGFRK